MFKKVSDKMGRFFTHNQGARSSPLMTSTSNPFLSELADKDYYLSLGQTSKLYGKVEELGHKAQIEHLDTILTPEKLIKTLSLLTIKAIDIQFNKEGSGYILTLDIKAKDDVERALGTSLKAIESQQKDRSDTSLSSL